MLWFKGCPKCGGDLQQEPVRFGEYIACTQCGHYVGELGARRLRSGQPHVGRTGAHVRVPGRMAS